MNEMNTHTETNAPLPKKAAKARSHRPVELTAQQLAKIAEGVQFEGGDIERCQNAADGFRIAMDRAELEHPTTTFWVRVAEAQALHAELEEAALKADLETANERWQRLFDADTGIRTIAQGARRKKREGWQALMREYEAARERTARKKGWIRAAKTSCRN